MGKNRKASDRMAECIVQLVYEYRQTIEHLNSRIKILDVNVDYWKDKTNKAVEQCDKATDTLGEIADIIAGFTEHTDDGYIKVYLSNLIPENAVKLERLFKLIDIPMTADQIKDGDTIEED
jgi:hypothetical protein